MTGHPEQLIPINYKLNGWYFGNILIGGVLGMLIIDPLTGGMWKIQDRVVDANFTTDAATVPPALKVVDIADLPKDEQAKLVKLN